jgi:hypothetical protein
MVSQKISTPMNQNVACQQTAIEQLLDAINLILNQSNVLEALEDGGNLVETPVRASCCFDDTFGVSDSFDQLTNKKGILPTPKHGLSIGDPLSHPNSNGPRLFRQASSIPFWEQQAPFNTMTLPEVFKILENDEEDRIVCLKKIHKLGFRSVKYLRHYFSKFGTILKIVILPSRQKEANSYYGSSCSSTVRPASMGFLVMADKWSADRILKDEIHHISDWPVEVSRFNRHGSTTSPLQCPSIASIETQCPYPISTHY